MYIQKEKHQAPPVCPPHQSLATSVARNFPPTIAQRKAPHTRSIWQLDFEAFLKDVLAKDSSAGFGPHINRVLYTPRAAKPGGATVRTPARLQERVTGKIGQATVRPFHTARV